MNLKLEQLRANTRRHFFKQSGLGFGAIALQQMLSAETAAAAKPRFRIPAKGQVDHLPAHGGLAITA
jgi:hypothetical protein